jgi:pimeloyl-ACP methyl ester carboxylesterase
MSKQTMQIANRQKRSVGPGAGILSLPVIVAGSWIAYSNLAIDHHLPLPKAINAEQSTFYSKAAGQLCYYADRSAGGRPIVLIHSVNAAASSYELKPIFKQYRGTRPVYALDLPGFGFSERSRRIYSPKLYEDAVVDFLTSQVGGAADIVALSLGCEFAARAALARPDLVHSITMISPSGFSAPGEEASSSQRIDASTAGRLHDALAFPLWGRPLYDLIATRRSIRYFLQKSFVGEVDPKLAGYAYTTSHQPGAHHAPLYFISGNLFTRNIRKQVYEQLAQPVLVIYDCDAFVRFDTLSVTAAQHSNWRLARISPTLGLPQFERLSDVVRALGFFWEATD